MKFYMHAGSLNHGCEAIVRSTLEMVKNGKVELFSEHPDEDVAVKLDGVCDVKLQGGKRSKKNPMFMICKGVEVIFNNSDMKHWYAYKNVVNSAKKGDTYVSIGGDNYCYGANPYLMYLNRAITKRGGRTILWGCSIEPDVLKNLDIVRDMNRYSAISARETITYEALKSAGVKNIYLYPDPAFTLGTMEVELPEIFKDRDIVGLNLSPLVQKLDASGKMVFDNYVRLVRYIVDDTDLGIVLIPHVCKPGNDDRDSMKRLCAEFSNETRIQMVNREGTMDCRQLKHIISKCKFMVTARTHASIAAYSTCIPTLVVGYSVKAKGIAKDIFGTWDGYVVDIHNMKKEDDLKTAFGHMEVNYKFMKIELTEKMPRYIARAAEAGMLLK